MIWDVYPESRISDPDFYLSQIRNQDPGMKKRWIPGSGSATLPVTNSTKSQKDEQRWHLLACKYNQFCGVPLL
jgi:hypothetical protein